MRDLMRRGECDDPAGTAPQQVLKVARDTLRPACGDGGGCALPTGGPNEALRTTSSSACGTACLRTAVASAEEAVAGREHDFMQSQECTRQLREARDTHAQRAAFSDCLQAWGAFVRRSSRATGRRPAASRGGRRRARPRCGSFCPLRPARPSPPLALAVAGGVEQRTALLPLYEAVAKLAAARTAAGLPLVELRALRKDRSSGAVKEARTLSSPCRTLAPRVGQPFSFWTGAHCR